MAQNIYHTRERERPAPGNGAPRSADFARWVEKTHRSRWRAFFTFFSLVVLIGLLGGVVGYQHRLIMKQRSAVAARSAPAPEPAQPAGTSPEIVRTAEWEPSGRLLLDEQEEEPAIPPPAERPPLTTPWVLQAARELRAAENHYRQGNWDGAIAAYLRARSYLPGLADVEAKIGLCHIQKKAFAAAEASFLLAHEAMPDAPGVLNNLGVARMAQGRLAEAEEALQAALERRPDYAAALRNLAVLKYRAGTWAEAVEKLRAVRIRMPDDAEIAHMLAISLIRLERWNEAVSVLRETAHRWPDIAPVHFRLAQALSQTDQNEAALQALQKAVQILAPARALAWLARPEFDRLRGREDFQALVLSLSGPR